MILLWHKSDTSPQIVMLWKWYKNTRITQENPRMLLLMFLKQVFLIISLQLNCLTTFSKNCPWNVHFLRIKIKLVVCKINCGSYLVRHTQTTIEEAKLQEKDIDRALLNLFSVQLRLGLFDGDPRKGQFRKSGPQEICTSEHKMLALEAARQGIVLLKNKKKFLPWNRNAVSSLAIIGPMANNISNMGGGYTGKTYAIMCNCWRFISTSMVSFFPTVQLNYVILFYIKHWKCPIFVNHTVFPNNMASYLRLFHFGF